MSPNNDQMKTVFLAALDQSTAAERTAFLDAACAGDTALRRRVDALLRAHDQADPLLDRTAAEHLDLPTGARGDPDDVLAFLDPPSRPDALGRLGHYDVLQIVGRGGTGLVVRAFDDVLQRVVAIKVLAPQLATSGPARHRFSREARAAAAVTHDNVIAIHAVEDTGPVPYLVMQFVDGLTLQEKLDRSGPLPLSETLRIGLHVAEGLAAAHRLGLVHRDVKPANILLENGVERVKLSDFGLARAVDDASLTQHGVLAGTPMYMSPEQAQGEPVDLRSDLFSLGSVLYAMCTGRPPFRAPTALAVLKRVCEETPRPVREVRPELPPWFEELVARLHAKAPADRFASAREVADLLAQRLAELQHDGAGPLPTTVAVPKSAPRAYGRRLWVAAAAALLLAFGGLGVTEATGVTKVRGTVVRLFSPKGTLVVEVDDPEVSVQIDGSDLVIKGAGAREIRLTPGDYTVEARKDGKVVRRDLVTVEKNGRQVVKVSQEPSAAAARKPSDAPADPTSAANPIDSVVWERAIAALPATEQVKRVAARMQERNPSFDGKLEPTIENGVVTGLKFRTNEVSDISPVRALTSLRSLSCDSRDGKGKLTDLSPLRGLKLRSLSCTGNPIADLSPLSGMLLREVACDFVAERDADILRSIKSLESINSTPAQRFWSERIRAMIGFPPLTEADLKRIAALPPAEQVEEVRKDLRRRNPEFSGELNPTIVNGAVTGLALSTEKISDIAPVRALARLTDLTCFGNRWTKGRLTDLSPLRGLPLAQLTISNNPVFDLSPLKGMKLRSFNCTVTNVSDLSPLAGMPLEKFICAFSRASDLSPIRGMKLTEVNVEGTDVSDLTALQGMQLRTLMCYGLKGLTDLSPLRGMPLTLLNLQNTGVSDLAPLKGMPLDDLNIPGTRVADLTTLAGMNTLRRLSLGDLARLNDLSPLRGLPVEVLHVENFKAARDATILRTLSALKSVNGRPAADFWKEVDAKAND